MANEFKDIPEYIGYYKISNTGIIKALSISYSSGCKGNTIKIKPETIMSTSFTKYGYERVCLSVDGKMKNLLVHRLVAITFYKKGLWKNFCEP